MSKITAIAQFLPVLRLRRSLLGLVLIGSLLILALAAGDEDVMRLDVEPQHVLIGDPVSIKASGLAAGQIATLRVSGQDQFGNTWSSEASFRADDAGTIDVSRDAPVEGSYRGIDQAGLFWSMSVNQTGEFVSAFPVIHNLTVSLYVNGREVDSRVIQRIAQIDLVRENLTDPIVGVFLIPEEITEPTPAIIVLGGSEGGYKEGWASVIASKTRMPTLALAYFGAPGLPPTLENIPVETVGRAIEWLNQQPVVARDHIGIVGASRGGELALLAASIYPEIKAVVGYTPSGVIWSGIGENPDAPAWTYQGRAFPYLRVMVSEEQERLFTEAQKSGTPYLDAPSFIYSLEMQRSLVEEATIPVENSQAAFLLIGNPGDGVWPSDVLSQIAIERLRSHNHSRTYRLLSYDQGGHMLIAYPYYPTTMRQFYLPTVNVWEGLGGTAEGAARAAEDSWPRVIEFLKRELA